MIEPAAPRNRQDPLPCGALGRSTPACNGSGSHAVGAAAGVVSARRCAPQAPFRAAAPSAASPSPCSRLSDTAPGHQAAHAATSTRDPYEVLGVERSVDAIELRATYRRLSLKLHPDKGGDAESFAEMSGAYELLSDPVKRAAHDNPPQQGGGFHGFHFSHEVERDKTLKLDHSPQLGWFLRLSQKEEAAVRGKISASFQQLEARKDGVKFTCGPLRRASDARVTAERDYAAAQRTLVERVVDVAASFAHLLHRAGALLSELDVLASFADVAATAPSPYTRPRLHAKDSGRDVLRLVGCRHPCVEALGSGEFVPNDCLMAKGDSWFQIITGPNMGGKSTYIRQVGVCVLLAQVGCFVPAQEAELVVRDAIFCRVGAGDCQLRGISTFMAEMLETAAILRSATPSSLVIIDELGRGTSTYDGFGLAWAIAEHICNELQAPALFATHFHELTSLQGAGGVKNLHVAASMDAQSRKLTMLYALRGGACDQSFGIHCAEFARFPPEVLHAARLKAAELEQHGGAGGSDESLRRGAQAARAFLAEVAALPAGLQTPEALRAARDRMLAAAQGSPYLDALIAAAQ